MRLARASTIRGRATGVGSELALASDMRFASREHAILSQWKVGAGLVPGGGPMARLPRLIGRGRALEILLGADDVGGDLAERHGYVNRSRADSELDGFVDKVEKGLQLTCELSMGGQMAIYLPNTLAKALAKKLREGTRRK